MTHNYVNNLDCTITDTDTSLMWTQMPSAAMTWEGALAWAERHDRQSAPTTEADLATP